MIGRNAIGDAFWTDHSHGTHSSSGYLHETCLSIFNHGLGEGLIMLPSLEISLMQVLWDWRVTVLSAVTAGIMSFLK